MTPRARLRLAQLRIIFWERRCRDQESHGHYSRPATKFARFALKQAEADMDRLIEELEG